MLRLYLCKEFDILQLEPAQHNLLNRLLNFTHAEVGRA